MCQNSQTLPRLLSSDSDSWSIDLSTSPQVKRARWANSAAFRGQCFDLEQLDEFVNVEGAAPDVQGDEVLEGGEVGELADFALVHEHDVPDVRAVLPDERHLLACVKPVLLRSPEIAQLSYSTNIIRRD